MEKEKSDIHILVVDDEENIRDIVSRTLSQEGYSVSEAANGDEALRKIGQYRFDIMFLDIKMPGIDGLEVLSKVKTENSDTKVILLTGAADSRVLEAQSMENGAFASILKPCSLSLLIETTEKALGSSNKT